MTRRLAAILLCAFLPMTAMAIGEGTFYDSQGSGGGPASGPSTGSLAANAVGTCADGSVLYDQNGVQFCVSGTDAATANGYLLIGEDAYEFAATNTTGGSSVIAAGEGTSNVTIVAFASCAGDTITVTTDAATTVLTEGVNWTAAASNNATATSLATAINALASVSSTASSEVAGIKPDSTGYGISVATSDTNCATVVNGTDGTVNARGTSWVFNPAGGNSELTVSSGAITADNATTLTMGTGAIDLNGVRMPIDADGNSFIGAAVDNQILAEAPSGGTFVVDIAGSTDEMTIRTAGLVSEFRSTVGWYDDICSGANGASSGRMRMSAASRIIWYGATGCAAGTESVSINQAAGTPEGAQAAAVGSLFMRSDGTQATGMFYQKLSGTGNTGWTPVLPPEYGTFYAATAQTVAVAQDTWTKVVDMTAGDTLGMTFSAANDDLAPSGAGHYDVSCSTSVSGFAAAERILVGISVNGATPAVNCQQATQTMTLGPSSNMDPMCVVAPTASTDEISLMVYNDTNGNDPVFDLASCVAVRVGP